MRRGRKRILIELEQKFPLSPSNVVAVNRGLAVRNFGSVEEAAAWLRLRAA